MNKKFIFIISFLLFAELTAGSLAFSKTKDKEAGFKNQNTTAKIKITEKINDAEKINQNKYVDSDAGAESNNAEHNSAAKTEAGSRDIINKMPQSKFISPKPGAELKKKIKIKLEVEAAFSVEFYLRKPESLIKVYIGKGVASAYSPADKEFSSAEKVNFWEYSLDTTSIPNGKYYLIPKIVNQYGEYEGSAVEITINNKIKRDRIKEERLKQEVSQTKEIIKEEERAVEETTNRIKEDIQKKAEDLAQKAQEVLEEPHKHKVEEELKKSLKGIEKDIKEFTSKVKQEVKVKGENLKKVKKEKEEIKKEIIEKAIKPVAQVKEEIKKKPIGQKISKDKTRTKGEIVSLLEEMEKEIAEIERFKKKSMEKLSKDSDNDGVPDYEEIRLETDPFNPDTDGDGVLDGTEIAGGYNPLSPSPAEKIVFQDPRKTKSKETNIYKVEKVAVVSLPSGDLGLKLEGKGKPNSFVTIYIFSSFLTLVTKTDENGRWEYILDKPLSKGEHEVYVAITDNQGKIVAQSKPFKFIKTAVAVAAVMPPGKKAVSPSESLQKSFLILIIGLIVLAIGIALIIVGISAKKESKSNPKV